ncbi:MAG: FadR/GntR family transcriptional regulator [Peptococcaceae bacterium]
MLFNKIGAKDNSIQKMVIREIKTAISEGRLKPGDKIPSERELAALLGVSRTSLREALKILEISGVVTIKHGLGIFIAKDNFTNYMRSLINPYAFANPGIQEVFQIRRLIETEAAAEACRHASNKELAGMFRLLDQTKKLLNTRGSTDILLLAKQDSNFHQLIIAPLRNSLLEMLVLSLLDLSVNAKIKAMSIPGRLEKSLAEHLEIARALEKRDETAAKQAMLLHLASVEKDILEAVP